MAWSPHDMKFEVGMIDEYVMNGDSKLDRCLSRTRKLITQIAQVCQELRDMSRKCSIKTTWLTTHGQPSEDHRNKEPQSDICEKGGRGCTRLKDNKTCDHCEGQRNSPNNPACHAESSPHAPLPSTPASATSSHASSEANSCSPIIIIVHVSKHDWNYISLCLIPHL